MPNYFKLSLYAIAMLTALFGQERSFKERIEEGQQLEARGEFAKAERIFIGILRDAEGQGAGIRITAPILDNLSAVYVDLGRYDDAERISLRLLLAVETATGSISDDTGRAIWKLAGMYMETGRVAEATRYLQRFEAIVAGNIVSGVSVPADSLVHLGLVYINWRQPAKALPVFQKALATLEADPLPDPNRIARALINRAAALASLDRYAEAIADLEHAADIIKNLPEELATLLIDVKTASGMIYAQAKHRREALRDLAEASHLAEITYGPDHPILALVLRSYSAALLTLGEKKEAKTLSQRADRIFAETAKTSQFSNTVDISSMMLSSSPKGKAK